MRSAITRVLVPTLCTMLAAVALGMHLGWGHWAVLYDAPIAWPFASFLLDRARDRRQLARDALDALVIVAALARSVVLVPLYSGHALFLGFVLLVCRTRMTRIAAALVLVQVVITKLFVLGDPVTLAGGLALAGIASALRARAPIDVVAR